MFFSHPAAVRSLLEFGNDKGNEQIEELSFLINKNTRFSFFLEEWFLQMKAGT